MLIGGLYMNTLTKINKCIKCYVVIVMLVLFMPNKVYASDIGAKDDTSGINAQDYEENNKELYMEGVVAKKVRTNYTLSLAHYYQTDSRWSADTMAGTAATIGREGCALTSFAMIANYLSPAMGYNPKSVNIKLGSSAYGFHYANAASIFGYNLKYAVMGTTAKNDAYTYIVGALSNNVPIMVGMAKFSNVNDTHFVVARAYSSAADEVYIYDPDSGKDYYKLSDYLNSGYYVYRLIGYVNY